VGTFGRIDFLTIKRGQVRARARFRDYDGVVRSVTRYGSTKPRAEAALRAALRDRVTSGAGALDADARLRRLAEEWLREISGRDLAPATKEMYRDAVERHVLPGLGALRLREVSVPVIDRHLRLVSQQSGPGTAKTLRSALSGMMGLALRHGALTHNPVRDVARLSRPRTAVRALTRQETLLPDLVDFLLTTGLRIGEACAVRWSAVDLDKAALEVNSTAVRTRELGLVIQERPKTAAGWRVVALPNSTVALLRHRRGKHARADDVVFPSPLGRLRDRSNTTADLRRAFDRAGFAWATSHTLRKTVATRLDDAGLSARQIADQLGHARPSLTQDVYMGRKVVSSDAAHVLDM
jgi:integrase